MRYDSPTNKQNRHNFDARFVYRSFSVPYQHSKHTHGDARGWRGKHARHDVSKLLGFDISTLQYVVYNETIDTIFYASVNKTIFPSAIC